MTMHLVVAVVSLSEYSHQAQREKSSGTGNYSDTWLMPSPIAALVSWGLFYTQLDMAVGTILRQCQKLPLLPTSLYPHSGNHISQQDIFFLWVPKNGLSLSHGQGQVL